MIAENCLCPLGSVRGLLIVGGSSWWLRNYRRPLWIRDVARAPKKVGDYSENVGRLLRKWWATKSFRFTAVGDIVLDVHKTSLLPLVMLSLDALRASISLLGL